VNLSFRQTGVRKVRGRSYRGSDYADGAVEARSKLFVGVIVALLCAICPTVSSAQSQVAEYRLKAAFLFHFAEFVEWPPENASGPFVICIVGEDPFHGDLEEAVQGKSIATRVVRIRHIKQVPEGRGCHVLFIDKDESKNVSASMSGLHQLPVLTVGESDDFLDQGGIIRMFVEDRKIRFEINQGAAETANLKISSRLLLLATAVVGGNRR
jgi:hypothetical protein